MKFTYLKHVVHFEVVRLGDGLRGDDVGQRNGAERALPLGLGVAEFARCQPKVALLEVGASKALASLRLLYHSAEIEKQSLV